MTREEARKGGVCRECGNTRLCPSCGTHCGVCGTRIGEMSAETAVNRIAGPHTKGREMTKRLLTWLLAAVALVLLLAAREHLPAWLAAYNRDAVRVGDDLERLSPP